MNGRKISIPPRGQYLTHRTFLDLPKGMPLEEWRSLGRQIFVISDSSAWWLGDWLVYGQSCYPDRYRRAVEETSLDYQTLRNYAWVARRYSVPRRRTKLSFQHHAEVARFPEKEQDEWLDLADECGWSRNELRRRIRAGRSRDTGAQRTGQAEAVQIRLEVGPEQKRRWQEAARHTEQDLAGWMQAVLDDAAATALHRYTASARKTAGGSGARPDEQDRQGRNGA